MTSTHNGYTNGVAHPFDEQGKVIVPEVAEVLSPSACATWCSCPAKWWYRYGLQLDDQQNSARGLGKAIHSTMRTNFVQKCETAKDLPLIAAQAVFDEAWAEEADRTEFHNDENREALRTMGLACVTKYMKQAAPQIQPARVEMRVEGVIGGVHVRGIVDILDVHGRIIDLKSAKSSPPNNSVRPDYRFQISTYEAITPGASGAARLDTVVKLARDVKVVPVDFEVTDADRRHVELMYPMIQEGMRSGLYTPVRSGILCSRRYCSYWSACQADWGGEVKP